MAQDNNIWLIRTKQNKILGPITKQKIKDLIAKGSLTPEDEICSGNGYWFWIKEKELVDKYVNGDIPQDFNPVCEAATIVANNASHLELDTKPNFDVGHTQMIVNPLLANPSITSESDNVVIPDSEDLEYPDVTPETTSKRNAEEFKYEIPKFSEDKIPTSIKSTELSLADTEDVHVPDAEDLEYPDLGPAKNNVIQIRQADVAPSELNLDDEIDELLVEELKVKEVTSAHNDVAAEEETPSVAPVQEMPKPVRKKKRRKKAAPVKMKEMSKRNDKVVFYLIGLVISIVLYGVYYYYTSILGNNIISKVSSIIFPQAYAQSIDLDQKKKLI